MMMEWARMRVGKRIALLNARFQESVHTKMKQQYPEIQLPDFGIVQSDGFRQRQERGTHKTFEDKVSALIEMQLADHARAVAVLEATGGNLEDATNLLVALLQP